MRQHINIIATPYYYLTGRNKQTTRENAETVFTQSLFLTAVSSALSSSEERKHIVDRVTPSVSSLHHPARRPPYLHSFYCWLVFATIIPDHFGLYSPRSDLGVEPKSRLSSMHIL